MENSFNENINLGGNVVSGVDTGLNQQPVAPVYGPTVTTAGPSENYTINVPAQQLGVSQNMHSQIIGNVEGADLKVDLSGATDVSITAEAPVETAEEKENVTNEIRDNFIVPTFILKNLLSSARKVGTYNPIQVPSQVIDLELSEKGIKVIASNGKIDYECLNTDVRFKNSFRTCVDIKAFGEFVNTLDFAEVELQYDNSNGILTVLTPTDGNFYFPQKVDLSTQQPIELGLTFEIPYEDMTEINYEVFANAINQSKPVRDFPKVTEDYKGTYFTNLVLASDITTIFMQNNQDILKTQKFFVGGELCDLLASLDFNSTTFRIGFTTDGSNDIRAITVSDGKITLCGTVEPDSEINEEVCTKFWSTEFAIKMQVNTKKFVNSLKRVSLFLDLDKDDCPKFEIEGNNLRIIPTNEKAKDVLNIDNPTNYKGEMCLPIVKLLKIFGAVKTETFDFCVDNNVNNCICLDFGEYKWLIALAK